MIPELDRFPEFEPNPVRIRINCLSEFGPTFGSNYDMSVQFRILGQPARPGTKLDMGTRSFTKFETNPGAVDGGTRCVTSEQAWMPLKTGLDASEG